MQCILTSLHPYSSEHIVFWSPEQTVSKDEIHDPSRAGTRDQSGCHPEHRNPIMPLLLANRALTYQLKLETNPL